MHVLQAKCNVMITFFVIPRYPLQSFQKNVVFGRIMVCSPVESINRPLEVSMLGRRDYRTPQPQLLTPLHTPNKQLSNDSVSTDSSYSSPLLTQRMYDTEYDNLAIGRFMNSPGKLFYRSNHLYSF